MNQKKRTEIKRVGERGKNVPFSHRQTNQIKFNLKFHAIRATFYHWLEEQMDFIDEITLPHHTHGKGNEICAKQIDKWLMGSLPFTLTFRSPLLLSIIIDIPRVEMKTR